MRSWRGNKTGGRQDIFASMLLIFVVLIPFFFAKGLIKILGKDEMKRLSLRLILRDSGLSGLLLREKVPCMLPEIGVNP
jgi:hypothetical protein